MELPGSIHARPKIIDSQFITMGDFIGKGHFGEVYKGILNGGFVALKKVRDKSNVNEASSRQQLNDEVCKSIQKCVLDHLVSLGPALAQAAP